MDGSQCRISIDIRNGSAVVSNSRYPHVALPILRKFHVPCHYFLTHCRVSLYIRPRKGRVTASILGVITPNDVYR